MTPEKPAVFLTHPFQDAGLGQAPFRFLRIDENVFRMPDGTTKAGGTCAYCSTGIRFECVVQSSDNQTFVVGTDCIRKIGDAKLTTAAEDAHKRLEASRRDEKRRAEREAALQAQRARNGGLTDYEQAEKDRTDKADAFQAAISGTVAELSGLAARLADNKGGFRDAMAHDLNNGVMPRGNALEIVIDILAKDAGRRGSSAHTACASRVREILTTAGNAIDAEREKIYPSQKKTSRPPSGLGM